METYHAIRNSAGGYEIVADYNEQGDIIASGSWEHCQDAIDQDQN